VGAPAVGSTVALLAWLALWATVVPAALGTELQHTVAEFRPLLLLLLPALAAASAPGVASLEAASGACSGWSSWSLRARDLPGGNLGGGSLAPQFQSLAYLTLRRLFPGTEAFLYVGPMPDGFFRVFWISSIWLPTALFWAPAAVRRPMARTAVQLALLAGIFVSYSRGIWLGLAAGAMLASVAGSARARSPAGSFAAPCWSGWRSRS
jgi:hypothetical protein